MLQNHIFRCIIAAIGFGVVVWSQHSYNSNQLQDEYPDAPTVDKFIRRAYHASAVIGDYVYIDGGEITQYWNGEQLWKRVNYTLSIDMSESWTNDTVSLFLKDRNGAPAQNKQVIWPSNDNKTFFAFGGEESWLDNPWYPPPVQLWQFTADGNGSGTWNIFNSDGSSIFSTLTRPTWALGGVVDNTGFMVGGYLNSHSEYDTAYQEGNIAIPGIASFNLTSGAWSNDTAPEYLQRQNGTFGMLQAVPIFGPSGLLLITGTTFTNEVPDPFDNFTIYEPSEKAWYTQKTTGDIPPGRSHPCVVGVKGDNGTYEIFMFGGNPDPQYGGNLTAQQITDFTSYDAVYILSLPAFVWFKADYTPKYPRFRHTYEVVGKRQMLSIGGHPFIDNNLGFYTRDPFAQGLAIFDMTDLQWKSRYDADAEEYKTPKVIKDWYRENGSSPEKWNDPVVQRFFQKASPTTSSPSAAGTSSPSSPSSTTSAAASPSPSQSSTANTGAIAGGVVGGVGGVALVAGLAFWILRRKRNQRYTPPKEQRPKELHGEHKQVMQELPETYRPLEMDGSQHHTGELDGQGHSYLRGLREVPEPLR